MQLKHLKLCESFIALGNPPWSREAEDQAMDLYTKVLLESGEMKGTGKGVFWCKILG